MGRIPVVSIVIVAYRARDHVLGCLESLEAVEAPHESILVDDGSGDGTVEAVHRRFPATRVLAKPQNEGLVAGRNSALPMIRGRFCLMLDADTQVRPGAVERLVRTLEKHEEVGLVGPKLLNPDGSLQLSCRRYSPFLIPFLRRGPYQLIDREPRAHRWHLMMDFDHARERPVVWVSGAAQMWRAELPGLIGEYDRNLSSYGGEDKDWCLRVWNAGLEVRYVPEAEIFHEWQHVIRKNAYSRATLRALRDWYYLQWKHRRLRNDPRLAEANA